MTKKRHKSNDANVDLHEIAQIAATTFDAVNDENDVENDDVDFDSMIETLGAVEAKVLSNNQLFYVIDEMSYSNEYLLSMIRSFDAVHTYLATVTENFKRVKNNKALDIYFSNIDNTGGVFNIDIYINSVGGDAAILSHIFYSVARLRDDFKTIRRKMHITTTVLSDAYSGAAIIFLLGDTRVIATTAYLLFHTVQASYRLQAVPKINHVMTVYNKQFTWADKLAFTFLPKTLAQNYKAGNDVYVSAQEAKKYKIATNIVDPITSAVAFKIKK